MTTYTEKRFSTSAEKEAFVMSFLDGIMAQCWGKPAIQPAKEIVVAFFDGDRKKLTGIDIFSYTEHLINGKVKAVGAIYLEANTLYSDRYSDITDGSLLLSDFVVSLRQLSATDRKAAIDQCKSFMALLCNLINSTPDSLEDAKRLVTLIRTKMIDFLFDGKPGRVDDDGKVLEETGKKVLAHLANKGVEPDDDIVVMVTNPETGDAITNCNDLATLLITKGDVVMLQVVGGLTPYREVKKYDYICLSDFVTTISVLPVPSSHDEAVIRWRILSNFVTMIVYGSEKAMVEDYNIDIFERLMACREVIKETRIN